jgi:hypothetical protein
MTEFYEVARVPARPARDVQRAPRLETLEE